jgi:dihydropteroate synthase
MAVRPGVLRLGRRAFGPGELLVMAVVSAVDPASGMERVHAVAAEGADMVDLVELGDPGGGIGSFVAAVRDACPELVIGVRTGRPEVAREAGAAGADLLGGSASGLAEVAAAHGLGVAAPLAGAARAVTVGVEPERIIVEPESAGLEGARLEGAGWLADLVGSGWPVLVPVAGREAAGSLAATAVAAWLGARVFRVDQVLQTRRVLRMVSAIRGDIPPARAVRGLALGHETISDSRLMRQPRRSHRGAAANLPPRSRRNEQGRALPACAGVSCRGGRGEPDGRSFGQAGPAAG